MSLLYMPVVSACSVGLLLQVSMTHFQPYLAFH